MLDTFIQAIEQRLSKDMPISFVKTDREAVAPRGLSIFHLFKTGIELVSGNGRLRDLFLLCRHLGVYGIGTEEITINRRARAVQILIKGCYFIVYSSSVI